MKKTLLATAIAGVLGTLATGAQAATVYNQDGSKLDVYGNVQLAFRSIEGYDDSDDTSDHGTDSYSDLFDNGSTIGFRGEHIINPGLTGYFRAEFEFNADQQKGYYAAYDNPDDQSFTESGLSRGDQAYLGLTGNFGDLRIGSWDSLFDDWIADPISNNEYFDNTDAQSDVGGTAYESDKITYTSPIFSGLQFVVGTQYKGDGEDYNQYDYDAATGAGEFVLDDDNSASFFGGVRYTMAGWTLAAVYDDLNNFEYISAAGNEHDFGKLYGANLSYQWDTLRVAAKWGHQDAKWSDDADVDRYGLGARWGYGNGDLYGSYQYVDAEGDAAALIDPRRFNDDNGNTSDQHYNEFILGATYNLSSQMYVFLEGAKYDRKDNIGDGVSTGMVYSF
ncbi:porin [Kushneria phosphatilytica]|uniref:Porin n=1 Tax=Kushneria phosphatilytica TaxID=657387 RepID=A0A1S1NXV3_9GAMM|nr:porin [Kushneria phosphatilytica]OHV09704.1 porin [Kushneria phosphatilytica]QEL11750.1 porin [Kushneria phosphatilytica]